MTLQVIADDTYQSVQSGGGVRPRTANEAPCKPGRPGPGTGGLTRFSRKQVSTGRRYVPSDSVGVDIQFNAVSNSGYQAAASSYSWSHTCAGDNRFLAVDIDLLSVAGTSVTSITYNGVALSLIGVKSSISGAARVECWGLANPTSGINTIAVFLSASIASSGCAVSYTSVHQSTPTEAFNSAQATNVGAADATVSITPVADRCWVHGSCVTDDTSITANQTSRNNVTGALGSGADEDTGPITPAVATTISYTDVGAVATWAIAGYAIRPVNATVASVGGGYIIGGGVGGVLIGA